MHVSTLGVLHRNFQEGGGVHISFWFLYLIIILFNHALNSIDEFKLRFVDI